MSVTNLTLTHGCAVLKNRHTALIEQARLVVGWLVGWFMYAANDDGEWVAEHRFVLSSDGSVIFTGTALPFRKGKGSKSALNACPYCILFFNFFSNERERLSNTNSLTFRPANPYHPQYLRFPNLSSSRLTQVLSVNETFYDCVLCFMHAFWHSCLFLSLVFLLHSFIPRSSTFIHSSITLLPVPFPGVQRLMIDYLLFGIMMITDFVKVSEGWMCWSEF